MEEQSPLRRWVSSFRLRGLNLGRRARRSLEDWRKQGGQRLAIEAEDKVTGFSFLEPWPVHLSEVRLQEMEGLSKLRSHSVT